MATDRFARRQASPPFSVASERYDQQEEERFRAELTRFVQDSVQGVDLPEISTPSVLASGTTNDYDIGVKLRSGRVVVRFETDAGGSSSLSGFLGGTDGTVIWITPITSVAGTKALTLLHQNAGSSAANRIITPSAASIFLGTNGWAILVYDEVTQRWRVVVSSDIGAPNQIRVTNSAGTAPVWITDLVVPGFAVATAFRENTVAILSNSATPSIGNLQVFRTGGTTAITNFLGGGSGTRITLISENTITITQGTNIKLAGSVDYNMVSGDALVLQKFVFNGPWREISRTVI